MKIEIDNQFRGNAYIVQNGEVLCRYCGGYADIANEIPNTFETRFACASMSKTFVAVGILQLIEKDLLKFDDTIGKILDLDFKNIDPDVTIEQLITHTSGIPDYDDETCDDAAELWADYPNYKIRKNIDLFLIAREKPAMFSKGEKFRYNNTGFVILGMVIEKITGLDFDVYLKQNVFDVCGMRSTGYFEFDRLPANCAAGYLYANSKEDFRTNIFSVGAKGTGDGGAYVTVEDIMCFWNGLLENKLLSGTMVSKMLSKQSGDGIDPEEGYYGYGLWIIDNPDGKDYVYMQGFDPGVSAIAEYNPNNGMISVFLSNYCDNVWAQMRKIRAEQY